MDVLDNKIDEAGLAALVKAFIQMPNLKELNLRGEYSIASIAPKLAVGRSNRDQCGLRFIGLS